MVASNIVGALSPIAPNRRDASRGRRSLRTVRALVVSLGLTGWPAAAAAADPATTVVVPEGAVPNRRVVFETSGRSAWLERNEPAWTDQGWHLVWRPICASPCSIDVPATGRYRVSGPGVKGSRAFQLPAESSTIHVYADAGSSGGWGTGLAGVIVGGVLLLPAGILLLDSGSCDRVAQPHCRESRLVGGLTALSMSVVAGVGGLYLLLSNTTDLAVTPQAPLPGGRAVSFLGLRFTAEGVRF